MIRNIELKYDRDIHPDAGADARHKNAVNNWLSELTYDLNNENAVVEYYIAKNGNNHITFRNISPQLHRKAIEELARFNIHT